MDADMTFLFALQVITYMMFPFCTAYIGYRVAESFESVLAKLDG
jgi:hypothetical protein